ncbi:GGDEF domain-containing protein [Bacillus salitolerans]|uniref:GGDEF domain-containing protein n=1 Tax=Bacillus salitolerans TaxID=1437434 RepID=A0ABW4LQ85_9BACI
MNQLFFFPISFVAIVILLMICMGVNLFIRTYKKVYLILSSILVMSIIPFIFITIEFYSSTLAMRSTVMALSILSLLVILTGIHYLYRQNDRKQLIPFGVLLLITLIFAISPTFGKLVSYLVMIGFPPYLFWQKREETATPTLYAVSVLFMTLTGIAGTLSFLVPSNLAFIFLFSSFLLLTFATFFLLFFVRVVDVMEAAAYSSITDALTGLYNRRFFTKQTEVKGNEGEIGIIFCDIDNFKKLNDTQGHEAGDEALKHVARIAQEVIEGKGIAGRYGGEEIVLLVELEKGSIKRIAEELRSRIEHETVVTISVGISTSLEVESLQEVVKKADEYMYEAKTTGKNKVCGVQ